MGRYSSHSCQFFNKALKYFKLIKVPSFWLMFVIKFLFNIACLKCRLIVADLDLRSRLK